MRVPIDLNVIKVIFCIYLWLFIVKTNDQSVIIYKLHIRIGKVKKNHWQLSLSGLLSFFFQKIKVFKVHVCIKYYLQKKKNRDSPWSHVNLKFITGLGYIAHHTCKVHLWSRRATIMNNMKMIRFSHEWQSSRVFIYYFKIILKVKGCDIFL